jgi:hypothetical protein
VLRLKEEIAKVHEVPVSEVKIVFQGKEVEENMLIQVCSFYQLSTVEVYPYTPMRVRGAACDHEIRNVL